MTRLVVAFILASVLGGAPALAELPPLCRQGVQAKDPEEKIRLFTRCIDAGLTDPRDLALAVAHRGLAYGAQDKHDLAMSDFDQAIALDASKSAYFNNRGWVRLRQGRCDLAIPDFDQAIALDPKEFHAYHNRGECLYRLGRHDSALGDLNQAIGLNPNQHRSFMYRGFIFEEFFNYQHAREDFAKAVELAPANPNALIALAEFLATCPDAAHQDGPRAVELARKACSIREDASALSALAEALARSGRYYEAKAIQEKAMAKAKAEKHSQGFWDWLRYCQESINRDQPCNNRKYTSGRD